MFWDMSRSLFHLWPRTDIGVGQVLLQEKLRKELTHMSSIVSDGDVLLVVVL